MRRQKKVNEHKKRRQTIAIGLLAHTGHRSHASGRRWLRPWIEREHQKEMKAVAERFQEEEL